MPHPPLTIAHAGLTLTLAEWAARTGLKAETIRCRLGHLGWPPERALTAPADRRFAGGGQAPKGAPRPCPRLRRHRASGQAHCSWSDRGKTHYRYFGPHGSPEAAQGYARFALEWAAGVALGPARRPGESVFVAELVERYLVERVDRYYVKGGKFTSERERQYTACKVLLRLYGSLPAAKFGPDGLRACVQEMVGRGWVRRTVNQHHWRITRCFEWGVGQSLVPPDVHQRLRAVEYLQAGRTTAPDRPPVRPVPADALARTLAAIHPDPARAAVLADLVHFHRLTGMRPGELCAMRPRDLERAGALWRYTVAPERNKNLHRDRPQRYWLGPRASAILAPYLAAVGPDDRVWRFPPRGKRGVRRTPIGRGSYAEFVRRACDRAGVKRWHPHQLRHNRATDVQRAYEDDAAAAAAIGDTPEVAAAVYIDPADAVRRRIALEMG